MRISDWSSDVCSSDLRRSLDQREPLAVVEHCRAAESLGIGLPLEGVNRDQVPRIHCRNQPLQVRDAGMAGRVDRDPGNALRLDPIMQVPEAHEIGHDIIRWHAGMTLGENETTLVHACHEVWEAEANYAA